MRRGLWLDGMPESAWKLSSTVLCVVKRVKRLGDAFLVKMHVPHALLGGATVVGQAAYSRAVERDCSCSSAIGCH